MNLPRGRRMRSHAHARRPRVETGHVARTTGALRGCRGISSRRCAPSSRVLPRPSPDLLFWLGYERLELTAVTGMIDGGALCNGVLGYPRSAGEAPETHPDDRGRGYGGDNACAAHVDVLVEQHEPSHRRDE